MGTFPSPDAEKERASTSRSRTPLREFLRGPKTWKVAITVLGLVLRLVRAAAKVGDMFE